MKKNWIRFIGFCVIFILLLTWLNNAFSLANPSWNGFYSLPHNSVDVVFLGNSHSLNGFQPKIVNDLLHINSYSIGVPGENVFITYYELREILKTQKPKMIVLESFTVNLTDLIIPPVIFHFTDASLWNGNKLNVLNRFLNPNNWYTAFAVMHQSIDWNHPAKAIEKNNSLDLNPFVVKKIDPDLGYSRAQGIIASDDYEKAFQVAEANSGYSLEENLDYLQRIVELCNKENIKLAFVTIPPIKIYGETFKYYVPFDAEQYASQHQMDYLKFDTSDFSDLQFNDPGHVNDFGSVAVSIQGAMKISQELDLPMDQKALAYYKTFLFNGYTILHTEDHYSFQLNPQQTDATLEYRYTIFPYYGTENQVIQSTDWQGTSNYDFVLPEKDVYTLKIEVRNPMGDYQVNSKLVVDNR